MTNCYVPLSLKYTKLFLDKNWDIRFTRKVCDALDGVLIKIGETKIYESVSNDYEMKLVITANHFKFDINEWEDDCQDEFFYLIDSAYQIKILNGSKYSPDINGKVCIEFSFDMYKRSEDDINGNN